MKKLIYSLILITFSSCNIQKELSKEQNQSHSQYSRQTETTNRDSLWQWSTANSLILKNQNQWGYTQIKPIGYFTYSSETGFVGEAEQINILYEANAQTAQIDSQSLIIHQGQEKKDQQETKTSDQQSSLSIHKKMDKKPINIWSWIGIGCFVFLLGYLYFKKVK